MRTRRFTITAFLLCAIMVLGIGFAALTDQLDINGTVEISGTQAETTFDGDVYFDVDGFNAVTDVKKSGSTEHTQNATAGGNVQFSVDGDTATFMSTTFADVGDTTAIDFTIVNEFQKKVKITATISYTDNTGNVFNAEIDTNNTGWSFAGGTYTAEIDAKTGDTNGTIELTLAVELVSVPNETVNADVKVTFIAEVIE